MERDYVVGERFMTKIELDGDYAFGGNFMTQNINLMDTLRLVGKL